MTFGVAIALAQQVTIQPDTQEPGDNSTPHLTSKPTNSDCPFLDLLDLDVRFQIYTNILPDRNTEQVIDIFDPVDEHSRTLTALMSTNSKIRKDVLLWYSHNTSWLTNTGLRGDNTIQLRSTEQNTEYRCRFTNKPLSSRMSPQEIAAWERFWHYVSTQETIGPLVVEVHVSSDWEIESALEWLFLKCRDIQGVRRRKAGAGPWPTAPFWIIAELVLPFCKDIESRRHWYRLIRSYLRRHSHSAEGGVFEEAGVEVFGLRM